MTMQANPFMLVRWIIVAGTAVAIFAGFYRLWALRRASADFKKLQQYQRQICLNCGYDMRGNPKRCSECGTPAPSEPPIVRDPLGTKQQRKKRNRYR